MADRRKTELQEVMHGSRIVPQETMETLEDRATKMRAFQAMKAQQARVSVTKSESLVRKTYENSITCELPNKGFTADVLRLNIFFFK